LTINKCGVQGLAAGAAGFTRNGLRI